MLGVEQPEGPLLLRPPVQPVDEGGVAPGVHRESRRRRGRRTGADAVVEGDLGLVRVAEPDCDVRDPLGAAARVAGALRPGDGDEEGGGEDEQEVLRRKSRFRA